MPIDCLAIKDVGLEVQPNVVVVMPRLTRIAGMACRAGNYPFLKVVPAASALPRGIYLLHVRSMGGRSINKIIAGN